MNKKIIATYGLSNTGGIAILDFIYGIEDKVKFAYFSDEKYSRVSTSIIRTDSEGQHYFNSGKCKYFLSDFIIVFIKINFFIYF